MRLRLRIERHKLPPIQAIWPITDPKATIAQLLQAINGVFPLEADTWGLEDYSVSLAGFELLHYHELSAVCKDEDDLIIRPLSFRDVRARTLTGRDQITIDGRHLLDGIPFGKPALRGPMRPELRIPPRVDQASETENSTALVLAENDDESDDVDLDYADDATSVSSSNEDTESSISDSESNSDKEEDASELSDDTGAKSASSRSNRSTSSDSTSSSSSNSSDSGGDPPAENKEEAWDGIQSTSSTSSPSNSSLPSSPTRATAGLKRKRAQESEISGSYDVESAAVGRLEETDRHGIPFQGLAKTKARNARRRDTKRLKLLVESGVLASGSTLQDLKEHMEMSQGHSHDHNTAVANEHKASNGNAQVITSSTSKISHEPTGTSMVPGSEGVSPNNRESGPPAKKVKTAPTAKKLKTSHSPGTDLEDRRTALLNQIAAGGVDVTDHHIKQGGRRALKNVLDDSPPDEISSKAPTADAIETTPLSRAKLDLESSKRLVFGALGVRVPKTQEDKDRVRRKLAHDPKSKAEPRSKDATLAAAATAEGRTDLAQENGDPEAWRQKINLRAVECCDENVTLSTPPFPFQQRWDPQQKRRKAKMRVDSAYVEAVDGGKKSKQKTKQPAHFETYDKYNINGYGDALEYDDMGYEAASEYWEDGALLESEEIESEIEQEDIPKLPEDVESLPFLAEAEVQEGDMITFTELACDATTNWEPVMATRSAVITELPHDDLSSPLYTLRLANRDLAPVTYDEKGNRLYAKFEMPDDDAETLAYGNKRVLWGDLQAVRLLSRPKTG